MSSVVDRNCERQECGRLFSGHHKQKYCSIPCRKMEADKRLIARASNAESSGPCSHNWQVYACPEGPAWQDIRAEIVCVSCATVRRLRWTSGDTPFWLESRPGAGVRNPEWKQGQDDLNRNWARAGKAGEQPQ